MANMFTELTLPELPRWATDVGATLEPSEAKKDEGSVLAKKPPARWDNWLKNQMYQYCQQGIRTIVSNFTHYDFATAPTSTLLAMYHPDFGLFSVMDVSSQVWTSQDGMEYTNETTSTTPTARACAIDSTYMIYGLISGNLLRRDSAAAYTSITSAAIGGAGSIQTICTKYPTSDLIMVTRSGVIRRSTTGTGGSWVAATTPPPTPITTGFARIVWDGASNWFLMQSVSGSAAKTYISSDDGDTWAATSTFPFSGLSTGACQDMAINTTSGMLVAVGDNDSNSARIEYSEDDGTTWTLATINLGSISATESTFLTTVYHVGQNTWVAFGDDNTTRGFVLVSSDGKTWNRGIVATQDATVSRDVTAMCSSERLVVAGGTGGIFVSLCTGGA
jgi:hypothetical protein